MEKSRNTLQDVTYLEKGGPIAWIGDFASEFISLNRDSDSRETLRTGKWILAVIGATAAGGSDALPNGAFNPDYTGLKIGAGILVVSALLGILHRTKNGVAAAVEAGLDRRDEKRAALRRGDIINYH